MRLHRPLLTRRSLVGAVALFGSVLSICYAVLILAEYRVLDGSLWAGAGAACSPAAGIPRAIHQTWKTATNLPGPADLSVQAWKEMHPEHAHHLHDDAAILERVRARHPELLPAYRAMRPIQRADLFRYLVLLDEGVRALPAGARPSRPS